MKAVEQTQDDAIAAADADAVEAAPVFTGTEANPTAAKLFPPRYGKVDSP